MWSSLRIQIVISTADEKIDTQIGQEVAKVAKQDLVLN